MTESLTRLHRPKADTIEIADLLEEAKVGKYELPDFQRDLAWRKEDRIKLFDSIYRGFPIGDILFWEPEKPMQGAVRFGPFTIPKRQESPWLIVDGQQRLATLLGCLLLPERNAGEPEDWQNDWRFAFHVDKKQIVELPLSAGSEFLPLPIAIDTSLYLKWARNLPEEHREARTQAADDFSKALRTYRIPFYVVRTHDRRLLQEVFERVNNTGKALSRTAVFNALFAGDTPDRERLQQIADELETLGFGRLQPDWLLQAVKTMVGMDPVAQFSAELRRMDAQDESNGNPGKTRKTLETIHPRLKLAAEAAIKLLQSAGICRVEALPYALMLPLLVHYFDRFSAPGSRSVEEKLRRLVWLVAAGGARNQHRATYQRAAARFIRNAKNAEDALTSLIDYSKVDLSNVRGELLLAHHDWRSGATRLVALALFQLNPVELDTGAIIPVWDVLPIKGDELFRQLWAGFPSKLTASSANRLVSATQGRAGTGPTLESLAKNIMFPVPSMALASQAITKEAWTELRNGDRAKFLQLRSDQIATTVDSFLRARLLDE